MQTIWHSSTTRKLVAQLLAGVMAAVCMVSCKPMKPSVPLDYTVKLTDPMFTKLAAVTQNVALKASGELIPGQFNIRGIPLQVSPNTHFALSVTVPVEGSASINVSKATGQLSLSAPVKIYNVQAPSQISLNNGAVSADVDFARLICDFILSSLQATISSNLDKQNSSTKNPTSMRKIISNCTVESAVFNLKPASTLDLHALTGSFAKDSILTLANLHFDNNFDYDGSGSLDVNLSSLTAKDSAAQGERTTHLETAHIAASFTIKKRGEDVRLQLPEPSSSYIAAAHLDSAENSQSGISFDDCRCDLKSFTFSRASATDKPKLTFDGTVKFKNGTVNHARTDGSTAQFSIPDLADARFTFDNSTGQPLYELSANSVETTKIRLSLRRQKSRIDVGLKQAALSNFDVNRATGVAVSFGKGTCQPDYINLIGDSKHQVHVLFSPGTTLSLSALASQFDEKSPPTEQIPIQIHDGKLKVVDQNNVFTCDPLDGKLVLVIAPQTVKADGQFRMTLRTNENPFGLKNVKAEIPELDLHHQDLRTELDLKGCRVTLPANQLEQAINKSLPRDKTFNINKDVMEQRRWRYRNLKLGSVTVSKPLLTDFAVNKSGSMQFTGRADISAAGTVERFELHPLHPSMNKWNTHPWTATGHVKGNGDVKLKFIPGRTLADSAIEYNANCRLAVPDDLSVDWSKVAGDVLGDAERAVINGVIQNANYFVPEQGIPVQAEGKLEPFRTAKKSESVRVRKFKMDTVKDGIQLTFDAAMGLN